VRIVLISMGPQGAVIADNSSALYAPALKVSLKNSVGAGDSMLAGVISGLVSKKPLVELLKIAVATATASIVQEGTGLSSDETLLEYYDQVEVREI